MFGGHTVLLRNTYCMASKYSHAVQTSQARSLAKRCPSPHPKVAFEATCSCAQFDIKPVHDGILYPSLNQCWNTFCFEYLPVGQYNSARVSVQSAGMVATCAAREKC